MIELTFVASDAASTPATTPSPVPLVQAETATEQASPTDPPAAIAPPESISTASLANPAPVDPPAPPVPLGAEVARENAEPQPLLSQANPLPVNPPPQAPLTAAPEVVTSQALSSGSSPSRDAIAARQQVLESRLRSIVQQHHQKQAALTPQEPPVVANPTPPTRTALNPQVTQRSQTTINTLAELPYEVEVLAIMRAIVFKESSGNPRAVNPHSGALGYGQIMPSNLPRWSQDALGRRVSRREFLNNPALQLQIIGHRLNQYWRSSLASSNGDESIAVRKVASLWYSGSAKLFNSYASQYYGGHRYPSIAEYTLTVLRRYQQEKQSLITSIASNSRFLRAL